MTARMLTLLVAWTFILSPAATVAGQDRSRSFDSNGIPILESVKRMAAVVRGMEVVRIPGATHASSVRPSAEPLVAFLDKHRPD